MKYHTVTIVTFDRNIIRMNWKQMNKHPLAASGNLVRKIARNSIRRRGYRTPPNPPSGRPFSRQSGKNPPFKQIYSVPGYMGFEVVVGMVGYGGRGTPIPGTHELGLRAVKTVNTQMSRTRPVRTGPRRKLTKAQLLAIRRKLKAAGIIKKQSIQYPERPFMRPALKIALPQLPLLWRNSLSS